MRGGGANYARKLLMTVLESSHKVIEDFNKTQRAKNAIEFTKNAVHPAPYPTQYD